MGTSDAKGRPRILRVSLQFQSGEGSKLAASYIGRLVGQDRRSSCCGSGCLSKPESTEGVALQQRNGRRVAKGGDGSGRIQGRWVRWRPFGSRVETLWPFADVGRERTQQETLPDRG